MKKIAYLLITIGILALLYGLMMDTSIDGSVYNLSLGNQRISILIFGGFFLLGGIVLLANFKSNQSTKETSTEYVYSSKVRDALNSATKFFSNIKIISTISVVSFVIFFAIWLFSYEGTILYTIGNTMMPVSLTAMIILKLLCFLNNKKEKQR